MQAIRSINHTKLSKYIFLLLSGNELENPFFFGTSYWTPYPLGLCSEFDLHPPVLQAPLGVMHSLHLRCNYC